ncbi:hypothetical protein IV203_008072 [Nitzschia inconspicua]|uniref:Uncharacterized protein n=1 Tax=Nitzschia inconspicua TaxID=303405 RepID=A0A9K3KXT7_9STRA|nr:hypothetical protein IV203_008072 [Nitzschia inconspicua]
MRQETREIAGVNVTLSWPTDDDLIVKGVTFLLPGSMVSISEYNGLRDVLIEKDHLVVSFFINVLWPFFDNHQTQARKVRAIFDDLVSLYQNLPQLYSVVGHSVGGKIALLLTAVVDPSRVGVVLALDAVDTNPVQFTNEKGGNFPLKGSLEHVDPPTSGTAANVPPDPDSALQSKLRNIPIVLTCTDGGLGIPKNHNAEAIHRFNSTTTTFHRDEHAGHMAYCDNGGGWAGKIMPDIGTKEGNANARKNAQNLIRQLL